jgi:putative flippase GtrA
LGLSIDMGIYVVLVNQGMHVNYSSAIGSFFAIIFVYYMSKFVMKENKTTDNKLLVWIAFQAVSIITFSSLVKLFYSLGIGKVESKFLTIPMSFLLNYIVMTLVIKH